MTCRFMQLATPRFETIFLIPLPEGDIFENVCTDLEILVQKRLEVP